MRAAYAAGIERLAVTTALHFPPAPHACAVMTASAGSFSAA